MENFTIRPATEKDIPGILWSHQDSIRKVASKDHSEIQISAWGDHLKPDDYLEAMRNGEEYFVAVNQEKIMGFASIKGSTVMAVYISGSASRKGVGKALYYTLEQLAVQRKIAKLRLSSSLTGREFYRKLGFQEIEEITHRFKAGAEVRCFKMEKELTFNDQFSKQSEYYVKFRPSYPDSLFSFLSEIVHDHDLAVDCATGSGQAALGLAKHFNKVIAVEASQTQLQNAIPHPKVEYILGTAETFPLPKNSVDIITAASGVHWFDTERFYSHAREILKPNGVLAVWAYYGWSSQSGVDKIIYDFEQNIVGDYWPKSFQKDMRSFYLNLDFPFDEIRSEEFELPCSVTLQEVTGYLRTFSATQRYIDKNGRNPTDLIANDLANVFSAGVTLDLTFKTVMRVGRI